MKQRKAVGVEFRAGETCVGFDLGGGVVEGARFAGGLIAQGDHYVLAVPIESAQALMSPELAELDPQCDRLRAAKIDGLISWMVGIQFYLYEDVPLVRGHMVFPDAPWALTAISQPQFWREPVGLFRRHYGNGDVGGRWRTGRGRRARAQKGARLHEGRNSSRGVVAAQGGAQRT